MSNHDDLEYVGKVKGMMTFKEHEQARLLKHMVLPASELAARKQAEIDRAKEFTRAAVDQEFYAVTTEPSVSRRDPSPIGARVGIVTREPYDEQP
ncbi:hypothetical protein ICN49_11080 [Polynucleobacter sp. MWH-Mekk-B1]|uniref:hypothetical protein n=1 Tax=Polynucleobacter finlandensis TaxID=1855894 RepID=UPI001C0E241F|nr:hypothetical protein [Polynucleobacter finlandensis]MBU3545464.1 hypothetical protein [Polynucleobacter finlandensis]